MYTHIYIYVFIHIISEWAAELMSYFGNFGGNCVYVGNYVGNHAGTYALILFHDFSFGFNSFTVQWCTHIRTERRGPRNQTPQNCSLNSTVRLEIPGVAQRSQTKLCSHLHTRSARWKIFFFFLFLTFLLFLSSTDFSLPSVPGPCPCLCYSLNSFSPSCPCRGDLRQLHLWDALPPSPSAWQAALQSQTCTCSGNASAPCWDQRHPQWQWRSCWPWQWRQWPPLQNKAFGLPYQPASWQQATTTCRQENGTAP